MKRKIIIANWKTNLSSAAEAINLTKKIDAENLIICPPFIFLESVKKAISKSRLGAQDLSQYELSDGPVTGEITGRQLKKNGVRYVIIGHSERKNKLGETNDIIAKKMRSAINNGLIPILCVGENLKQKKNGQKNKIIKQQLLAALQPIMKNGKMIKNIIIAYEPGWAISSNKDSKPADIGDVLKTIQYLITLIGKNNQSKINYIYGGSITSQNTDWYLNQPLIDGLLIGQTSLDHKKMKSILGCG